MVVCSPVLVSYITRDWFFFFLILANSLIIALLTIPSTFKRIAAAPAYKEVAFAVVRSGKALLALLVAVTPADPRWLPLRLWGSTVLPARWKLWTNLAWYACFIQVSIWGSGFGTETKSSNHGFLKYTMFTRVPLFLGT
jgi:hypothetical protein